jgi:hypothetical protein
MATKVSNTRVLPADSEAAARIRALVQKQKQAQELKQTQKKKKPQPPVQQPVQPPVDDSLQAYWKGREEAKAKAKAEKAEFRKKSVWQRMQHRWTDRSACSKGCLIACIPCSVAMYFATFGWCCHCCGMKAVDEMACGSSKRLGDDDDDE